MARKKIEKPAPNSSIIIETLLEKIPKNGMSQRFRRHPNLTVLAKAYALGIEEDSQGFLPGALGMDPRHIASIYSRFAKIIPLETIEANLKNPDYYAQASLFSETLRKQDRDLFYQRRENAQRRERYNPSN